MEFKKSKSSLGGEILNLNLNENINSKDINLIKNFVDERLVVLIRNQEIEEDTSDIFDKQQIIKTKQDTDFTGSTQGDTIIHDSILENIEPDFIYYDTIEMKRADSVDAYMRHWYEVLDTNSNGEIDDMERDTLWE